MVETSNRFMIDNLFSSNRGELIKKNNRETNFKKIGEKQYRCDKTKPISDGRRSKLNKIKQAIDYQRHEVVEKKGAKWLNVEKKKH